MDSNQLLTLKDYSNLKNKQSVKFKDNEDIEDFDNQNEPYVNESDIIDIEVRSSATDTV